MNNSLEIKWGNQRVTRRWLLGRLGVGTGMVGLGMATRRVDASASSGMIDAGIVTLFVTLRMRSLKSAKLAKSVDPITFGVITGMVSHLYRRLS